MAYITDPDDVVAPSSEWAWPSAISTAEKTAAIQQACDMIDQVTRSHWEPTAKTLFISGDGTDTLDIFKRLTWPIVTITEIYYRDVYTASDDFDTTGTLVASTDYRVSLSRRSIRRIHGTRFRSGGGISSIAPIWVWGDENYRVKGTFGRANTPTGIVLATKLLTRELVDPGSTADHASVQSEKWADGYSYVRSGGPTARNPERLTGYPAVDDILIQFVDWTPFMAVPR